MTLPKGERNQSFFSPWFAANRGGRSNSNGKVNYLTKREIVNLDFEKKIYLSEGTKNKSSGGIDNNEGVFL